MATTIADLSNSRVGDRGFPCFFARDSPDQTSGSALCKTRGRETAMLLGNSGAYLMAHFLKSLAAVSLGTKYASAPLPGD